MPLSQQAIQELSELSVQASGVNIDNLQYTDHKVVIIPEHTDIQSLEKFNKTRDSFRGNFDSESIDSFIEYNKNQVGDNAACFVNAEKMLAKTVFDLGTKEAPLHCHHTARLGLAKTSDYNALLNIITQIGQKTLSDFIEDWSDNISCFAEVNGDEKPSPIPNKIAVQAVRKVKIESSSEVENEVGDFKGKTSLSQRVEAKAGDSSKCLPALIVFECAPYNGLKEYTFNVRVSAITSNSQPVFSLRIVNHEKQCNEMVEEFMSIIVEKLSGTDIKTYIGSFSS